MPTGKPDFAFCVIRRDHLAETRERYETFLATDPVPAVHEKGRCWHCGNLAVGEADGLCPACKMTDDDLPAFLSQR